MCRGECCCLLLVDVQVRRGVKEKGKERRGERMCVCERKRESE